MSSSEICVYSWFKRWEKSGIVGLKDKAGRGRKPILPAEVLIIIKEKVQENAERLKIARQKLKEELGREFSTKYTKGSLKKVKLPLQKMAQEVERHRVSV